MRAAIYSSGAGNAHGNGSLVEIIAIDPGPEQSAILFYGRDGIRGDILANTDVLLELDKVRRLNYHLAVEMVASYGMAVGKDVFETVLWIGRFIQCWPGDYTKVYRKDVKLALCGSLKAKDANIRQALIDIYGPGKDKAIGTKKAPGPLYGIKSHLWSALAIAVTLGGNDVSGENAIHRTDVRQCRVTG